jgi:hypothetical protein
LLSKALGGKRFRRLEKKEKKSLYSQRATKRSASEWTGRQWFFAVTDFGILPPIAKAVTGILAATRDN